MSAEPLRGLKTNAETRLKPLISKVEATSGIEPEYTVLQFAGCYPNQSSLMPIRLILFSFGVGV